MSVTLAFIHTGYVLIPVFSELARKIIPEVESFHMLDESLIRNTIRSQALTKTTIRRLAGMIESARLAGADAVMVTCSSIGEAAALARSQFDFPILRVDEPMAETAVAAGRRVGVAATLSTTLEPTVALLRDKAAEARREIEIVPTLCEGAFESLLSGDAARHDSLVTSALGELMRRTDVIVLAQASMARVADRVAAAGGPPILSSPELAVRHARRVLLSKPAAAMG